jgi:tetratricopeptide (TPR) repeat protein
MSNCALCKKEKPEGAGVSSATEDKGPEAAQPLAKAETSFGQFEICEACYEQGLPVYFTQSDLAEIHYQFGLEYLQQERSVESVDSLSRALQINESADILAALGHAESKRGDQETAISHYQRALEIDPSHATAKESLKGMMTEAA